MPVQWSTTPAVQLFLLQQGDEMYGENKKVPVWTPQTCPACLQVPFVLASVKTCDLRPKNQKKRE
jgi:hypothetical protein